MESVADLLRPGTFELDAETFDAGLLNSQAIVKALGRSDLFCLFLSSQSIKSAYVDFETLLGLEFLASGKISRFIVVCLDEEAFDQASANVKFFNIIRRGLQPESVARLIQGQLVSAAERSSSLVHPFTGRDEELLELENQVTDHRRPATRSIFISGNFGSGRKTLAQKFYERRFPQVGRIFPTVVLDAFAGLEELYRKVIIALRPTMSTSDLKTRLQAFGIASSEEKSRLIAQLFNSLQPAREAALLIDTGGVLSDSGQLESELNDVIGQLDARPYPPLIIVAPRMIPRKLRRIEDDISYVAVKSLARDACERLVSGLLKDNGVGVSDADLDELVKLTDGHPFNVYKMIEEILERGIKPFLANPSLFIEWKHRQSSEYVERTTFSQNEEKILALLKQLPELDFEAIISSLELEPSEAADNLLRLTNLHIIEADSGTFKVSPGLRVALERDRRLRLPDGTEKDVMRSLAKSIVVRLEEGTASISLVDVALLAGLDSDEFVEGFTSVFLLPSHSVWLAKRYYDQKHWGDSIRFAREALRAPDRLSLQGYVSACRFMCLAAARIGESEVFNEGIHKLRARARDDWAQSNIAFLEGFNLRLKGHLPEAEQRFRISYGLAPGNISAAREIAAICLARDNLDEAERFAREARDHAPTNPYILDILISVLVRKHGRSAKHVSEINSIFDVLEAVDKEGGQSFFTTRRAEFEHLWGNNRLALELIDEAIQRTPTIFEPNRLRAEIFLKDGNKVKALEVINKLGQMVNSRDPNERRSNYRLYLKTHSRYLVEVGRYAEAKQIFDDASVFTEEERRAAIKDIEITQAFKAKG